MKIEIAGKKKFRLLKAIGVCIIIAAAGVLFFVWYNYYSTHSKSYKESEKIIDAAIAKELNKDSNDLTKADFNNTKTIRIDITKLSSLEPILKFKNIEILSLNYALGQEISFKPLTKLKKLKTLKIRLATIIMGGQASFTFVSAPKKKNMFEKLLSVFKKQSPATPYLKPFDINLLGNFRNLKELSLETYYATNIKALSKLRNLQSLKISNTEIKDEKALAKFSGLKNLNLLDLSYQKEKDIIPLNGLINVENLNLEYSKITDINSVANLTTLKFLNLSHTKVEHIEALVSLENLEELDLGYTKVKDIDVIQKLGKLKILNLEDTPVREEQVEDLQTALPELKILK